ncbi:hypothetical protein [Devriesea agamarum]|uniref:hypothetical protein n=1 Tax=Devriesea agamarum TaxID=472569 RepID=UPI00071E1DB0|nr:hypothetical protein [Devriesea agamarum]
MNRLEKIMVSRRLLVKAMLKIDMMGAVTAKPTVPGLMNGNMHKSKDIAIAATIGEMMVSPTLRARPKETASVMG